MAEYPHSTEAPATATAVAEPPRPPGAPPTAATGASPAPKRKRWLAWVVGVVITLLVVGALAGVVVWALGRNKTAPVFSAYRADFDSAMAKTKTQATFPNAPVELTRVSASGSHPFEATFTAQEVTALVNVFQSTSDIQGSSVAVSGVSIGFPSAGTANLRARVKVDGSSYSGSLQAPVEYQSGLITSTGATKVLAEGIPVGGDRAKQATELLLVYLNAYLDAAPGLQVETAAVTADGARVSGTAPDSISTP